MSLKDHHKIFTKLEVENKLFDIRIQEVPIWRLMRFVLFFELFSDEHFAYSINRKSKFVNLKNKIIFSLIICNFI